MGNCQAAEAAAVVIQHPGGKVERLYGAATAAEVMRGNPGHYVALVVLRVSGAGGGKQDADPEVSTGGGGRITKVKLLKPKDTLLLGQVYRLITSQEVAKAIQARREDRVRRCGAGEVAVVDDRRVPPGRHAAAGSQGQGRRSTDQERKRAEKSDRQHRSSAAGGRGRHWQPSLQSISEAAG
ncbi:unnamed protein product [Miscanthus lutarioriparius]|uniref:Uncharacterized protein n=1 Tax=Miscanthus lutarioriparius TaxID=422564 RepID=A0A811R608_9POAL|nr:unnamed protein product [Miscanthus lutarioriparius]